MTGFSGQDGAAQDGAAGRAAEDAGPCIVLKPYLRAETADRDPDAQLEEGVGLARAINLTVVHAEKVPLSRLRPATYMGKGTVERVAGIDATLNEPCGLVFVDANLSPVQQRNLETEWRKKVIDRTGLILEIFGARARTREGRLQVELAALSYQLGRLVRSWTHLERQRGGAGFMGGPGESQIELDRRLIRRRMSRLKKELTEVKRTRGLQRRARQRVPYPVIALVGYTNAGKSTLFNKLTGADVMAEDQLFATLDPTMRRLELPGGRVVILSDTVGFVSDLPHDLVEAFHATLEEVVEADLVLHVRDISHIDTEAQKSDVLSVLKSLGVETGGANDNRMVEVLNKIDQMRETDVSILRNRSARANSGVYLVSAVTGEGTEYLLEAISRRTTEELREVALMIPYKDGKSLAWVYDNGDVLSRVDETDGVRISVRLGAREAARLSKQFAPESGRLSSPGPLDC